MGYALKVYHKPSGGAWTDITTSSGLIVVEKFDGRATDVVRFSTTASVVKTDEIRVTLNDGTTKTFGGYVKHVQKQQTQLSVTAHSYAQEIKGTIVRTVYQSKSPEYIVEDLITNYTGLTYASTATSGITLTRFKVNSSVKEAVNKLARILMWDTRSDGDQNYYFEPEGTVNNGVSITVGANASNIEWTEDPSAVINRVEIIGEEVKYETTESFSGDGGTTTFTLSNIPISAYVTVGGTEKTGGPQGQTGIDYYVNREDKEIEFSVAPAVGVNNVVVKYLFLRPVYADIIEPTSYATYGEQAQQFRSRWLRTDADARKYALGVLRAKSEPAKAGTAFITSNTNIVPGEVVSVIDSVNSESGQFIVRKVVMRNDRPMEIEFGDDRLSYLEWMAGVTDRVKELEEEQATSGIDQDGRLFQPAVSVAVTSTGKVYFTSKYDTFIIGRSPIGSARTFDTDAEWNTGTTSNVTVSSGSIVGGAGGGYWVSPILYWCNSSTRTTLENFNSLRFNGLWGEDANTATTWAITEDSARLVNGAKYMSITSAVGTNNLTISNTLSETRTMQDTTYVLHQGDAASVKFYFDDASDTTISLGSQADWTETSEDTSAHNGKTITKIEISTSNIDEVLIDSIWTDDDDISTTWTSSVFTTSDTITVDILDSEDSVLQSGLSPSGGTITLSSYSNLEGENIKVKVYLDNTESVDTLVINQKPDYVGANRSIRTLQASGT